MRARDLRRALAGRPLTLATGLTAALPVIASTVRAVADGWQPITDQGTIATRAYDVFSSHAPLVGQYSFATRVTGHPTYSPGPLLYWLLALPARTGSAAAIVIAMGAVNAVAIAASVALARRRGGVPLMVAAALATAVMCHSLAPENLHAIFNPAAGVLPFTLLVFMCWSLACGDGRLLPLIALDASFLAQCHLGFLPPSIGLVAVGLAGLWASRRRAAAPARVGRWLAASALVLLLAWSAPLADQVAHSRGNLGLLVTAATKRKATVGSTAGWRAVVRTVGVPPRWLRPPTVIAAHVGEISGGDYGDTRIEDVRTRPGGLAIASTVVILAALVAVAAVTIRRRRADLAAAAAIALVLCAALAVVVASTPTSATPSLGYIMWWDSVAGMWVWLTLGCAALSLLPIRWPRAAALVPALAAGAIAAVAAIVVAEQKHDTHAPFYRPIGRLVQLLDRGVPAGRTVRLHESGDLLTRVGPAVMYALRRRDIRPLGESTSRLFGSWYDLDRRRYDLVVSVTENLRPRVADARILGRVTLLDRAGAHPITAALATGDQRRRGRR